MTQLAYQTWLSKRKHTWGQCCWWNPIWSGRFPRTSSPYSRRQPEKNKSPTCKAPILSQVDSSKCRGEISTRHVEVWHLRSTHSDLTFSVKQEEEATTTGRMDYTPSFFHVIHCNVNDMFELAWPASVGSGCSWSLVVYAETHYWLVWTDRLAIGSLGTHVSTRSEQGLFLPY